MADRENQAGIVDLLRHGATEAANIFRGSTEDPLSDEGWKQMAAVVEGRAWDAVITSPLGRCSKFARQFAGQSGLDVIVEERFAEYHFGDWDGRSYDEIMASQESEVLRFFDDPFLFTPPNAESFSDFHQRVVDGWYDVADSHLDSKVLVITHGGVILSVLAEILGRKRIHGRIDIGYASISRIQLGSGGLPHRLISHGSLPGNE